MNRENFIHLIKNICQNPIANITLNYESLNAFPLRSETRQGCCVLTTSIRHKAGSSGEWNKALKGNTGIPIRKGKIKLSVFADDKIIYVENSKEPTKTVPRANTWIQQGHRVQYK